MARAGSPRLTRRLIGVLAAVSLVPQASHAQERLVGKQSAGVGASFESIAFAGPGLQQYNFNGLDSARITRAQQVSTPITGAWAITDRWRVDLTGLYARATVSYRDAGDATKTRTATLAGVSDLRLRATGAVVHDVVFVTAGLNVPTGQTSLSNAEFGVLRIVAAPGLGMGSTPVGAGMSGTLGVVIARRAGPWSIAVGGSYEHRGTYQPIAALVAGSASSDFRPGGVLRASFTGDRTVGPHRLTLAVASDVFAKDELTTTGMTSGGNAATPTSGLTTVKLGPVLSADAQMVFAAPRFRQLLAFTSYRFRAPFLRDGVRVANSSGQYFDTGVRAALSLGPGRDLIVGVDGRLHTGLGVDQGLPTSGVASGSVLTGVEFRRGLMFVQPYLRAQSGVLRQRGVGLNAPSQGFHGFGLGFVAVTRF